MFKTRCPFLVHGFRGGAVDPYPDFYIPKGLRCAFRDSTRSRNRYILDEFPENTFPKDSAIRRDALDYGILIPGEYIEGDANGDQVGGGVTGESLADAMEGYLSRMHVLHTKVAKTGELALLGFQNGTYLIQIGPTVTSKNDPGEAAALWNSL